MNSIKELRDVIVDVQDRVLAAQDNPRHVKQRLSFDPSDYRRQSWRVPISTAAALLAVGIAAYVFLTAFSPPTPPALTVDGQAATIGEWISAQDEMARLLRFKDGSEVTVHNRAGLRVQTVRKNGAHLLLEKGRLSVRVVHDVDTHWSMDAGPYRITVTGTRFQVNWEPSNETLRLDLEKGSVKIAGPMLTGDRMLSAGETLVADVSKKSLEIVQDKTIRTIVQKKNTSSVQNPDEEPGLSLRDNDGASTVAASGHGTVRKRRGTETWQSLIEAGNFEAAVADARRRGIRRILVKNSASDILMLGDAARRLGDITLADQAYRSVYNRFPKTSKAAAAAFALGIIDFDRRGRYAAAARWFESSLSANPNGSWSRAASGRLLESLYRQGNTSKAEVAAAAYLSQYPNGPHAALARRILGQQ